MPLKARLQAGIFIHLVLLTGEFIQKGSIVKIALSLLFLFCLMMSEVRANEHRLQAIEAAQALAGTYTGHWDMYGLDKMGQVTKNPVLSWDDVNTFENPQVGIDPNINQQRAFGLVTDIMTYVVPAGIPVTTVHFTEGFKIKADGTTGEHYFTFKNADGQVIETIENQLAPNLWSYESSVDLKSFAGIGINESNVVLAKNLTLKSISIEGAAEIQTVSQTTTLIWKGDDGSIKSKQFVSMNGIHRRTLGEQK
jgi:hypothetical protein